MNRKIMILSLAILFVLPLAIVQACGPDFYQAAFVSLTGPDHPREYATGKLGVLLATYTRADLIVSYRYLTGGSLTSVEQAGYDSTGSASGKAWWEAESQHEREERRFREDPVFRWIQMRKAYPDAMYQDGQDTELKIHRADGKSSVWYYLNCSNDAFSNAVAVLAARAKSWGENSADMLDWVRGQDAVFANCQGDKPVTPVDAPVTASLLLRQDRAYQKAAALFYQARFDEAEQAFRGIAQDEASPWRALAQYLATRAMVRKAYLSESSGEGEVIAKFDPELMKRAQKTIESLLHENDADLPRGALREELDFVRLRTETDVRVGELAAALVGPKADPDYGQNLTDLTWHLDTKLNNRSVRLEESSYAMSPAKLLSETERSIQKSNLERFEKDYLELAELRAIAPMLDWLITVQSPAESARKHSFAEWKKNGKLEWLVAALMKATAQDDEAKELVKAAERVDADSQAWETTNFHRIRLLIGLGRSAEARTLLTRTMPRVKTGKSDSTLNLYRDLQLRAAASLDEALDFAPRKILNPQDEGFSPLSECLYVMKEDPKRNYDCKTYTHDTEFGPDAALFFNTEMPLNMLAEAGVSPKLPEDQRRSVAIMAWVRAVLESDDATAARVFPSLPAKIQQQAGPGTGFKPLMTLIRNPGLRPYLEPGMQRSYSFDFVESYRDNWWCEDWGLGGWGPALLESGYDNQGLSGGNATSAFLTPAQQAEGERQSSQLRSSGDAEIVLGERVLAYVKDHPKDADAAESLYLVLRMIRYSRECFQPDWRVAEERTQKVNAIRRESARLLRQRYRASIWTRKAAPFVA